MKDSLRELRFGKSMEFGKEFSALKRKKLPHHLNQKVTFTVPVEYLDVIHRIGGGNMSKGFRMVVEDYLQIESEDEDE